MPSAGTSATALGFGLMALAAYTVVSSKQNISFMCISIDCSRQKRERLRLSDRVQRPAGVMVHGCQG